MKRVLFVDDEKQVLSGLRRSLRDMHEEWDMVFAESGAEGLRLIDEASFDVVISDMRMPEMDGAEFLEQVRKRCPDSVRFILSGHASESAALRAVTTAHQFLSKPCKSDVLKSLINRTCNLQALLSNEDLRTVVGSVDSLPSLPATYSLLREILQDPDASVAEVAEVIERDIAISSKVLQVVNSSFFGLPQAITDVVAAVSYLGLENVKSITLMVEVFQPFTELEKLKYPFDALQEHAHRTACAGRLIASTKEKREDAFLAGLLMDIGKLILATRAPDTFAAVVEHMYSERVSMDLAETSLKAPSHARVGAYLIGLWGLPTRIVEAVAFSHLPSAVTSDNFELVSAVHVADVLSYTASPFEPVPILDTDHLAAVGVADRLPEWVAAIAAMNAQGGIAQ